MGLRGCRWVIDGEGRKKKWYRSLGCVALAGEFRFDELCGGLAFVHIMLSVVA